MVFSLLLLIAINYSFDSVVSNLAIAFTSFPSADSIALPMVRSHLRVKL